MCGIAGVYRPNEVNAEDRTYLLQMLERMRFRGPDDDGQYFHKNLAMGMVRLSIIDPQYGKQPIADQSENIVTVCNGELYNYIELREELEKSGYNFNTRSDVEILVHGYHRWGLPGLLKRIRGMYAFAIWDTNKQTLHLVRDPFGIKPLYYTILNGSMFFASDLNSLVQHKQVPQELNLNMLKKYFACGYPIGPDTFLKNVYQLLPGQYLSISSSSIEGPTTFWDQNYSDEHLLKSEEEILYDLDLLISESVKIHMRSDVPIGILLSSGIDSATILSYMASFSDKPVNTFTLDFTDAGFGEGAQAELIARHYGANHHQIDLKLPTSDDIERIFSFLDQPNFDYSCIPTFLVSKFARESVKAVLMGDGGDELFAGYPTSYLHRVTPWYCKIPATLRNRLIRPALNFLPTSFELLPLDYKLKRFVRAADNSFERSHYGWKLLFDNEQTKALFTPEVWNETVSYDPFSDFDRYFSRVSEAEKLNQVLYVDSKTFLVDDLLVKADRMTMANSLEARVPFLDRKIAEYIGKVPEHRKLPGFTTKPLLRKLARKRLPPDILKLKKRGFTPPFAKWIQGPLKPFVQDVILNSSLYNGILERKAVEAILKDHFDQKADFNREISLLLSLSLWHNSHFPRT